MLGLIIRVLIPLAMLREIFISSNEFFFFQNNVFDWNNFYEYFYVHDNCFWDLIILRISCNFFSISPLLMQSNVRIRIF